MSIAKRLLEEQGKNIYAIGDNPLVGSRVRVTWLKPWGKLPQGFTAVGILLRTMAANSGRTLIGEVRLDNGKKLSCPWSRRYLAVEAISQ